MADDWNENVKRLNRFVNRYADELEEYAHGWHDRRPDADALARAVAVRSLSVPVLPFLR